MAAFTWVILALATLGAAVIGWHVIRRRALVRRLRAADVAALSAAEAARQNARTVQQQLQEAERRQEQQARARQQRLIEARAAIRDRFARERIEAAQWREATRQRYLQGGVAALRASRRSWSARKVERRRTHERQQDAARVKRAQRTAEARAALAALKTAWETLEVCPEYLGQSDLAAWQKTYADALRPDPRQRWALPAHNGQELKRRTDDVRRVQEIVQALNARFIERRLVEDRARFDAIERYPLADQQRRAVVTNEDANLIVAGAGTGKTSTVVSRVDYLVRRGLARPEQILVVAYNRSAAEELRARLESIAVPPGVDVSTFHALGTAIIGQAAGARPRLAPMVEDVRERFSLFRSITAEMLADDAGRANLVAFLAEHLDEAVAGNGGSSADEQIRAERARGLRSLTGKLLRSREEVQIANWLTLNGIAWLHEEPYQFETRTPWKRAYLPDFYLPDHDIYVEHFGINRNGETAPHVNARRYKDAIQWKRNLHRDNGTTLVETYSWMREDGALTRELERLLGAHGVVPRRLSDEEISAIVEEANITFSDFLGLIDTFRALFQGQGASWSVVHANAHSARDWAFLTIFRPVYEAYRQHLDESSTIDFDDMINMAREHVQADRYRSSYTHIIVDEFQDISATRLGLLTDLRAQVPRARLFAVGDDWQSIYRFAGSDVAIMTNLPAFVGPLARVDLDLAYRFPQELVDLSSRFVTRNPAQLQKHLRAASGAEGGPPVTILYQETMSREDVASALDIACEAIIEQCEGKTATALILGRYNSDKSDDVSKCVTRLRKAQVTARFLTVHKAKGQEADFVILPDLRRGKRGFPSAVADDSVLRMVLSPGENFPHAEERRLFYVALTRAHRHVYLIAPERDPSEFVADDLCSEELQAYVRVRGASRYKPLCPRCHGHTIVLKDSSGKPFWGCEHYPLCHGWLANCPQCATGVMELTAGRDAFACRDCRYTRPRCPRCGEGYLHERNGRRGPFLGCSMFAREECRYTCDGHDVTKCVPDKMLLSHEPMQTIPSWPIVRAEIPRQAPPSV